MASLWESLFGATTSQPARPPSRGALLGMNYQAMPDMRASLEDRRPQGHDYTVDLQRAPEDWTPDYRPSNIQGVDPWSGGHFGGYDPLVASPLIATSGVDTAPGAYAPSFQQNLRPPRRGSFPATPPSSRSGSDSDLPYIGAHLPWSPGDPGWTPPLPSSGPHPRGMTLNSNPWGL